MTEQELIERMSATGRGDELLALIDKLGFKRSFVAGTILGSSATVTVAQIAMLWMGMPNKHDRKRTKQLLEALAGAGLFEADPDGESFKRVPD
jgi:hypothetical protein